MIALFHDWFGWPNGSVLTNLVATAIGLVVGYFAGLRGVLKGLHAKIDKVHEHLGIDA